MDGYAAIEAGLAGLLRAMERDGGERWFDDEDVTLHDYHVLNRTSPPYAVLLDKGFSVEAPSFGMGEDIIAWRIGVDLCVRFTDEAAAHAELKALRSSVMAAIRADRSLGGTAGYAMVREGAEPVQLFGADGGGPYFVTQTLTVQVLEAEP